MLDKYACPQPPDYSIVQLRVATHSKQVAPLRGLESTASRMYFLCCAGLLFEALECFLLRSWLSRLLRHPAMRAEWAYSYLLPGPTRGSKAPGSTLGEGRQTSRQLVDASTPRLPPLRGLESTASRIYFLCCAGLLFEALECFLLRSWQSGPILTFSQVPDGGCLSV